MTLAATVGVASLIADLLSNRLGCLGAIAVSVVSTLLLFVFDTRLSGLLSL